ncbi:hypothetical protein D3C81_1481660 [compost metagenome]
MVIGMLVNKYMEGIHDGTGRSVFLRFLETLHMRIGYCVSRMNIGKKLIVAAKLIM